jgi:hypothetical protein
LLHAGRAARVAAVDDGAELHLDAVRRLGGELNAGDFDVRRAVVVIADGDRGKDRRVEDGLLREREVEPRGERQREERVHIRLEELEAGLVMRTWAALLMRSGVGKPPGIGA